jgi:hypothetical protein
LIPLNDPTAALAEPALSTGHRDRDRARAGQGRAAATTGGVRTERPPASPEEAAKIDDILRRMMRRAKSRYSDPMRKYTD